MRKQLTDMIIKKLKVTEMGYEVPDTLRGLWLRVMPSGLKTWNSRYVFDGKGRRLRLGHYPEVSLATARLKHLQVKQSVRDGIDPAKAKLDAESERRNASSFKDLFDEFQEKEMKEGRPSTYGRKLMLEKNVLPQWGQRKIRDITKRDAVLLLDEVRERAPVLRNRLQGILTRMFEFAVEQGHLEDNRLLGIRRVPEQARSRVLTDDEIKTLWNGLDKPEIDIYQNVKLALKGVLLTGSRPGEICGMKWDEIHDGLWVLPPARSKNSEENRTPILPMFRSLLDEAQVYSGDSEYVFQSARTENSPINVKLLSQTFRRHGVEIGITGEEYTAHDLRRTLRTKLAELGVSDIVGEKILGHKLQGVLGTYNRHPYEMEKRAALSLWEQRLQVILGLAGAVSNVIPFEVRHA